MHLSSKDWFAKHEQHNIASWASFQAVGPSANAKERRFSYNVVQVKADATNSSVTQSSKAHVVTIKALWQHLAARVEDGVADRGFRAIAPDRPRVSKSRGGAEVRAMILKQLAAAGCPNWLPSWPTTPSTASASAWVEQWELDVPQDGDMVHIRCFVFASDSGPDQVGAGRLILDDTRGQLLCLYIRSWCWEHQLHLIVKRQLDHLGSWYWSSLAQLVHMWRAHHRSMFQAWTLMPMHMPRTMCLLMVAMRRRVF